MQLFFYVNITKKRAPIKGLSKKIAKGKTYLALLIAA